MFLPLVQVATDGSVAVVGGLDVRLPKQLTGIHPDGVPPHDEGGCFVANVVVSKDFRGRGNWKCTDGGSDEDSTGLGGDCDVHTGGGRQQGGLVNGTAAPLVVHKESEERCWQSSISGQFRGRFGPAVLGASFRAMLLCCLVCILLGIWFCVVSMQML